MFDNLNFDDFVVRFLSAIVLSSIAIFCLYAGSIFFHLLILFLSIFLFYEICKLLQPNIKNGMLVLQLIIVVGTLIFFLRNGMFNHYFLSLIPALILGIICYSNRLLSFCIGFLLTIALMTFFEIKFYFGTITLLWVISCVIVTDLAGYFIGRVVGGPKIWPVVSPKKTWSGLIGGWVLTILLGSMLVIIFDLNYLIIFLSLVISLSSQIGDFCESWLKRRVNKKDSSHLIPGHGGFLDRFDGFIGGAIGLKICLLFVNPALVAS